jgi:hypothetical protein
MTRPRRAPLPIDDRVEIASQLVVRTGIFLDIWDFYRGPSRDGILDTMNKFSEFFRYDEHAHRFSFIVHAAALFETNPHTINLRQLAKELRNADRIPDASMRELERLFTHTKRVIKGVHIIRNDAFGHRNSSVTFDAAFDMAKISMDDLHDLMNAALKVVNILLIACDRAPKDFFTLALEHARRVLAGLSARS